MDKFINKIIQGDCLIKLKELEDNSVDSIVTDPPAGISFMGREWDSDKGGRDHWIAWMQEVATECKRVLKPGGHAFVWTIPRTSHWTATAWENAGFEIRDVVAHIFGSGFPKSHNVEKAIQKIQSERSEEFKGIGTALKPAREDWILMRKPLSEKNVALNCLKWGTGGINIDESRVGLSQNDNDLARKNKADNGMFGVGNNNNNAQQRKENGLPPLGRFPANLIHDNSEEVRECFPETSKGGYPKLTKDFTGKSNITFRGAEEREERINLDSGNASRFFKSILYYPKASKSERNKGCEELEEKVSGSLNFRNPSASGRSEDAPSVNAMGGLTQPKANNHPTVKPIALMEYLIKMVTPKGGIVCDPFSGSGSTLVAAKQNGFNYIGIELTEEYIPIIEARLNAVKTENTLF